VASDEIVRPWYEEKPDLADEIRKDLRRRYPTLRLDTSAGRAEIRGTFPILDTDGTVLDRWPVSIELPSRDPYELPIVKEIGGRIPAALDNHVIDTEGTLCVLLAEERYRLFPRGAPFRVYLDGPLRSFLTNQSHRAHGGSWVHGEWEHGAIAAVRFYKELLESEDDVVGWRGLIAMGLGLLDQCQCPCGRRRPVAKCHVDLLAVRDNLAQFTAKRRVVGAVQERFGVESVVAVRFLQAIRRRPKGHHGCPCGSGSRVRDCHPDLRELRDAWPVSRRQRRNAYR
jgi:hypothetical protein